MKKKESGILTVEASMILSVFVLFVLFLFNFARVYRAQNMVSHAVLQASDAVAMESYLRETAFGGDETDIVQLANRLTSSTTISEESFTSLRSANLPKIAKEKFSTAIANSETNADKVLKNLGVKGGLTGVDFSASQMDLDNNDVILYANYTIELQFPILGMKELSVSKAAKSKTFGEILFALNVIPNNAHYGSVSGGGNYKHGTQVEISASPYYGYIFMGWDTNGDGTPDTGNAPQQTITVTGAQTYTAIFKTDKIPVKLSVKSGKGTVESFSADGVSAPSGAYDYLSSVTIMATPDTGYKFVGWSGFWYKDENGNGRYDSGEHKESVSWQGESEASHSIGRLEGTYELKAEFKRNVFTISVQAEGLYQGYTADVRVYSKSKNKWGNSLKLEFGTKYDLIAPKIENHSFVGWKRLNGSMLGTNMTNVSVVAEDVTYVAVYEMLPSISIQGGGTGGNNTRFTASTFPKGATVVWESSNNGVATVNNGYVTAKRSGSVTITATINYNGKKKRDSVSLSFKETTYTVRYCLSKGTPRYYYDTCCNACKGTRPCYTNSVSVHYTHKTVSESEWNSGVKISPGGKFDSVQLYGTTKYTGYNAGAKTGRVLSNGSGYAIYFEESRSGPGGYYINKITHH